MKIEPTGLATEEGSTMPGSHTLPAPATPPMSAIRRMGLSACLCLGIPLACLQSAVPQDRARLEDAARWAVWSAIPDGIDDWPAFTGMRLQFLADPTGRAVAVVCGTLEFGDPSAGRTHFVVLLAPDAQEWRESLGPPVFFGSHRAEGSVPVAALCEGPGQHSPPGAELRAAVAAPL
jgi:hypothetical protein